MKIPAAVLKEKLGSWIVNVYKPGQVSVLGYIAYNWGPFNSNCTALHAS